MRDSVDEVRGDTGLRDRSSLSSKLVEQFLLGFAVMLVLWEGGDPPLTCCLLLVSPWLAPAEITQLAFDLLEIL